MHFFRTATSIYGQETLVGVSWDLLWVVGGAAVALIIVHALLKATLGRRKKIQT